MKWNKVGLIYKPEKKNNWNSSHAYIPTPIKLNDEIIRIYVNFLDTSGISRPGFIDVLVEDPKKVINISQQPLLDIGQPGTFDDNGVACTSIVKNKDESMYMYYVGFELGIKTRYKLFSGLAISNDKGNSFKKFSTTPILDRTNNANHFRGGPFCLLENGIYKLWYCEGNEWITINEKQMPSYEIVYMESDDGINWPEVGKKIFDNKKKDEYGYGRPYILKKNDGTYRMFYSIRIKSKNKYTLGYAESTDGIKWLRLDKELNLDKSRMFFEKNEIMYGAAIEIKNKFYLFYNGDNFGEEGIGLAILKG